jgi:hypothetical protein
MVNPTYTGKFNFSYSSLNRNSGIKKSSHNGNRIHSRIRNFNTRNNGMGGCKPPSNCVTWESSICWCLAYGG